MLDELNRYAHGYLAVPVILSCRRQGLFDILQADDQLTFETVAARLGANRGHLAVAWRLLRSIGWLEGERGGNFHLSAAAAVASELPEDVLELIEFPFDAYLQGEQTQLLAPFIEHSKRHWDIQDPLLIDFLDGMLVIPLLVELAKSNLVSPDSEAPFSKLHAAIAAQIGSLFVHRAWAHDNGVQTLTDAGQFMIRRAMNAAATVSYATMIAKMDGLIFGDSKQVFERLDDGDEGHVDRTLNVVGSGFQHEKYFADLEQALLDIFNRKPFADQPRYVADMGCGDGTLLKRVYEIVRDRSERGAVLDEYPLDMIGLDFNRASLAATTKTLGTIPHTVLKADIGDPEQMLSDLTEHGIDDLGSILHIRSFLDHDRPYTPPTDEAGIQRRSGLLYEGVYVDASGDLIPSAAVVQSLVEHLTRWSRLGSRHGLIIIEVHCLGPETVLAHFNECENLHFDAKEAFSGQQLVEADVFLLSAAEAGLFPVKEFSRKYPKVLPFCRITLNRFEKRRYRARAPEMSDLPALEVIENACWREGLRTSADTLKQRIELDRGSHCVFELDGRVVGVVYTQRIDASDSLAGTPYDNVPSLRSPRGTVVQLLGFNVLPQVQGQGLADQFLDFALQWLSLKGDVTSIVGVSRCRDFAKASVPMEEYIRSRDAGGQLVDPILRLHEQHGARVVGLIHDYRPDDTDNHAAGVLIEYATGVPSLLSEGGAAGRDSPNVVKSRGTDEIVEEAIASLLRPRPTDGISPDRPLKELGLDSLDLLELRTILSQRFNRVVEPTFFFHYSTPTAIADFFADEQRREKEPAPSGPAGLPAQTAVISRTATVGDEQSGPRLDRNRPEFETSQDDVAIIGAACRFPGGANTLDQFWTLIESGTDAVTEVPEDRWMLGPLHDGAVDEPWKRAARFGGFLDRVDNFDAGFFNIAPREAQTMDPQQRILLELHWEALEHAGIDANRLATTDTGVFAGVCSHDYEYKQLLAAEPADLDVYFATGNNASIVSGRIAYALGLQGPAITVNTACSSSLVAVHLACQSLRNGESSLALASGANLMLSPELSAVYAKAGMLAPDGRCKTFDVAADGYVRSEGAGVVVLKLLGDALADGDPIMAVIRGTAINQDGASNGLTAPNGFSQKAVFKRALKMAGLRGTDVSYIEAHGTGTSLGDPVEVDSIDAVYGRDRDAGNPLILGSVKTNIGHAEAAAGLAGLLKVVLCLQHRRIPPHLHFTAANSQISLDRIPAVIPVDALDWQADSNGSRVAGINSFGFSGTNAHVIVEEAPVARVATTVPGAANILALSARTEEALVERASDMADYLEQVRDNSVTDVCFTATVGRAHLQHRLAFVTSDLAKSQSQLRRFAAEPQVYRTELATGSARRKPRVAFLFSGQGSQYVGMGRELFETESTFRRALERCDEFLRDELEQPLLSVLYPQPGEQSPLDETAYTQPALFALEYALCALWRSWGVEPDVVLGHSVGEYAAACAANVFALEDGLALIAARGRLMQALPKNGSMVAVLGSEEVVVDALSAHSANVSIAALNGPDNCVISGASDAVDEVVALLEAADLRVAPLSVSHAFHSPLMDPILTDFEALAAKVEMSVPDIDLISNLSGGVAGPEVATAAYWRDHIRNPVRFAGGMAAIEAIRPDVLIEIGPRSVLLNMGRACFGPSSANADGEPHWLPSICPPEPDRDVLLGSLARVYACGANIDWLAVQRDRMGRTVSLPSYPWQHESYWLEDTTPNLRRSSLPKKGIGDLLFDVQWHPDVSSDGSNRAAGKLPAPTAIAEEVRELSVRGGWEESLQRKSTLVKELDVLSLDYVVEAVHRLGLQFRRAERFTADELASRGNVAIEQRRLLDRLLATLENAGVLRQDGDQWEVLQADRARPAERYSRLQATYPDCETELTLLGRCGGALADVLRGASALQLLFPDGSLTTAERLYQDSPFSRDTNKAMQDAVAAAARAIPDGSIIRVLEIGAGTGGTTAHLLPVLPEGRTRYHFTDVSAAFTNKARDRFGERSGMTFGLLDISNDPQQQGYEPEQFDIVVGASVLHATPDLRTTLRHAKKLLAPGGLLLLVEGTRPTRWVDLIFGLLEGWWLFSDHDLRSDHPLISAERWQTLLAEEGFSDPVSIANAVGPEYALFPQSVILAQQPLDSADATYSGEEIVADDADTDRWLIFVDEGGVGAGLADRLRQDGDSCTLVRYGDHYNSGSTGDVTIDPANHEHFERLLAEAPGCDANRFAHLWSLDIGQDVSLADLDRAQTLGCRSSLHLIQGLAITARSAPHNRLWLITGDTLPAGDFAAPVAPLQAGVWGFGSVAQQEHPELGLRLVDLAGGVVADQADALFAELRGDSDETMVALRNGERLLARLAPLSNSQPLPESQPFSASGTHLITGGFGAFGLIVADWLVDRGVRNLALVGRSGATESVREKIDALREKGVEVLEVQADIAVQADVERLGDEIQRSLPPLRGVFHCAGVVDPCLLFQQDWSKFQAVIAAKFQGAWNLHHLTAERDLDCFVLFSSIASFIGQTGQGSYSVANAYLDGLARYRKAVGLPALSVNWGVIRDVGLLSSSNVQEGANLYEQLGIGSLTPTAALNALALLLRQDVVEAAVLQLDAATLSGRSESPVILADLIASYTAQRSEGVDQRAATTVVESPPIIRAELAAMDTDWQRQTLLENHISAQVAEILRTDVSKIASDTPLQELGLDSLMGVELRNRLMRTLEMQLSATLTWRYPTVEQLADYLDQRLESTPACAPETPLPAAVETIDTATTNLDEISDDEAAALLTEKLEALEREG